MKLKAFAKGTVIENDCWVWADFRVFTILGWVMQPILIGIKKKESHEILQEFPRGA
jgi:hypothetical protein